MYSPELFDTYVNMDPCLIILNCLKNGHKRDRQRNTWLRDFPITKWYHIIGDPSLDSEYKLDQDQHILYVKCADDYLSLPSKTFLACKAVYYLFPSVTHILKTDDDMDCHTDRLSTILDIVRPHEYGGGVIVEKPEDELSTYHYTQDGIEHNPLVCRKGLYCPGRFYFMNHMTIAKLLQHEPLFMCHGFEDNMVGHVLTYLERVQLFSLPDKILFFEYAD